MTKEKFLALENTIKILNTDGCSNPTSHSEIFEEVIEIVKPKNILEIGFFCGNSAAMWLELSEAKLTSVDPFLDNATNDYLHSVGRPEEIGEVSRQLAAVESVRAAYPDRFRFVHKRSLNAAIEGDLNEKYDLCFVDGDHLEAGATIDLNICQALKIPFLLLDDFNEMYNGVRISLAKMQNRFANLRQYNEKQDGSDIMFIANLDVVKINEQN